MTSQISSLYINIDETYPVAGVDNDTQGFRDNFDIIKSSLAVASSEITDLQDTTAKTNASNNFAGNSLTNTILVTATEKSYAPGVFSEGTPQLQLRNGSHQRVVLDADDLNIVLSWKPTANIDLEDNRYGRIIVEITTANAQDEFNVVWASEGGGDIKYDSNYPSNFKVTYTPKLIEFTTYDSGTTVFARYLGDVGSETPTTTLNNLTVLGNVTISGSASIDGLTLSDIGNISNVDVTTTPPTNGQVLKYNSSSGKWIPGGAIISSIGDILNVDVATTPPTNGQVLKYNSISGKWVPGADNNITSLSNLTTDVSIFSPSNGNILKYNSLTSKWENISSDTGEFISFIVKVVDDGSGTQETFEFNGNKLKDNIGNVYRIDFVVGNRYRFDLSDPSNTSRLKFSTTPDTAVPASITPYTVNVSEVGTAGTAGAYTEILITPSTPELYFYLNEVDPMIDTSNIGGSVKIQKTYNNIWRGSEDLSPSSGASLTRSASYFSTQTAETATLGPGVEGQIKVFAMYAAGGDMVITVDNAGWKATGSGTITFDAIGDACTLQYINGKWFCTGNNGATFS